MTWPLAMRMGSQVVGQIGDNIYFVWLIEWFRQALFEIHTNPLFVPHLNFPEGWNIASTDVTPVMVLLGLPAAQLAGPAFGYNFSLLLSFVLSGLFMYLWVHHLTGSRGAGLVAGAVYAFLPFRMAHFLAGHLNLSGTQWFPLFFWGLTGLLWERRLAWKPVLLAAVSLGLIGLSAPYYLYMTLIIGGIYTLGYFVLTEGKKIFHSPALKNLGLFSLCTAPLVLLSVMPYFSIGQQGGLADRTVEYASLYSATFLDYALPSPDHFLAGEWVNSHFDRQLWMEGTFYIGATALGLSFLAFVWRKDIVRKRLVWVVLLAALAALVFSLGVYVRSRGEILEWDLPPLLAQLLHKEQTRLPLPALLLFKYLPFYSKMRAIMRIGFFVLVFTSLASGLGAAAVLKRVPGRATTWTAAGLIVLVLFEFYPGPYRHFAAIDARPVDYWLAQQPGAGAVAQFPFGQAIDQDQVYNTLVHRKPFIGGFFNANQTPQYTRIQPVLDRFPAPDSLQLLNELGVQYVIVDTAQYADFPAVEKAVEQQGLRFLIELSGQRVYELSR